MVITAYQETDEVKRNLKVIKAKESTQICSKWMQSWLNMSIWTPSSSSKNQARLAAARIDIKSPSPQRGT